MVGIVLNYCQRVDMLSFMVASSKGEPRCCFINDSVVSVVLSFPGLSFRDSNKAGDGRRAFSFHHNSMDLYL